MIEGLNYKEDRMSLDKYLIDINNKEGKDLWENSESVSTWKKKNKFRRRWQGSIREYSNVVSTTYT